MSPFRVWQSLRGYWWDLLDLIFLMYLFWSGLQRPSAAVARGVSGAGSGFRVGWRTVGGERLFLFFRSYLMVLPLAEGGGGGAGRWGG